MRINNKLIQKIRKHLTIQNLILGVIMIILTYILKHYVFNLFNLNYNFEIKVKDFQFKFYLPKDIIASLNPFKLKIQNKKKDRGYNRIIFNTWY